MFHDDVSYLKDADIDASYGPLILHRLPSLCTVQSRMHFNGAVYGSASLNDGDTF